MWNISGMIFLFLHKYLCSLLRSTALCWRFRHVLLHSILLFLTGTRSVGWLFWKVTLRSLPGGFPENYSDSSIVFVDMLTIFHASCCTKTMMTACLVPVSHYFRSRSLRVSILNKSISRHPSLTICINKRKLLLKMYTSLTRKYKNAQIWWWKEKGKRGHVRRGWNPQ